MRFCGDCGNPAGDARSCVQCGGFTYDLDNPGSRAELLSYRGALAPDPRGGALTAGMITSLVVMLPLFLVFRCQDESYGTAFTASTTLALLAAAAVSLPISWWHLRKLRPSAPAVVALERRLAAADPRPRFSFAATLGITALCVLASLPFLARSGAAGAWGATLGRLHGPGLALLPASLFVHAGLAHLASNLLWLVGLGLVVEQRAGRAGAVAVFTLGGMAGALVQLLLLGGSVPVLGASGGVLALAAAWLVLDFGRDLGVLTTELHVPSWLAVPTLALVGAVAQIAAGPGGAWGAHLGGFAAGLVLGAILRGWRRLRAGRGAGPATACARCT
ncbi:MAG TPA: rhomboid family intramembrane serine protease [Polyangia bacterium]|jgi:hypothetical protein